MNEAMKREKPDLPQKAMDAAADEVLQVFEENIPSFMQASVEIYDRYFSAEEIKGMLAFYQTPLGRKSVEVMPALMSDSMQMGAAWGQSLAPKIGPRVRARLKKEGVEI